jgi:hypothetical protein
MDDLNTLDDYFDRQLAQEIINRDNSLTESEGVVCGSDQDLSGAEEDDAPVGAVGGVPDGVADGAGAEAVVPFRAWLPLLHLDPAAARRHMLELEDKLHRADALGIPLFVRWHLASARWRSTGGWQFECL